jgi:hypothetical protein
MCGPSGQQTNMPEGYWGGNIPITPVSCSVMIVSWFP